MQINVINDEGKVVGTTDVPEAVFGGEINEPLLWEQVKAQRASKRRGTHETKTRANVRGGGAKPLKQKGSGQARQGSRRSPNHVGGGTVFGPHPRDYSYRLPWTGRRAALLSALASRATVGKMVILDGGAFEAPNTKKIVHLLSGLASRSALFAVHDQDAMRRSVRNLQKSKGLDVAGLNVYDILDHEYLVMTRGALTQLLQRINVGDDQPETTGAAA